MKRFLPVLVLAATPILGIAIGTIAAWQKYPQSNTRGVAGQFEDVSARSTFIMWGGGIGAAVGVLAAAGLTLRRRPAPKDTRSDKPAQRCPSCGARHPVGSTPQVCDWCHEPWQSAELATH